MHGTPRHEPSPTSSRNHATTIPSQPITPHVCQCSSVLKHMTSKKAPKLRKSCNTRSNQRLAVPTQQPQSGRARSTSWRRACVAHRASSVLTHNAETKPHWQASAHGRERSCGARENARLNAQGSLRLLAQFAATALARMADLAHRFFARLVMNKNTYRRPRRRDNCGNTDRRTSVCPRAQGPRGGTTQRVAGARQSHGAPHQSSSDTGPFPGGGLRRWQRWPLRLPTTSGWQDGRPHRWRSPNGCCLPRGNLTVLEYVFHAVRVAVWLRSGDGLHLLG